MGGWTVLVLLTVMSAMYAGTRTIGAEATSSGGTNRAFKIAEVKTPWPGDHESYSGYVQTNITGDMRLFYWFCMAKKGKRGTAPVLLWLNGGPGFTSLVGAMLENGPYQLNEDGTVSERTYAWTNEFHMLYVDSHVGVGYSYSPKGTTTPRKMEDIAENLFQLVYLLMSVKFQEQFDNGLYIGGQSYAGKYIPHLGERIHRWNMHAVGNERINLQGVYLGNALCDPETMIQVYPDTLYHMGLLSRNSRNQYRGLIEDIIRRTINNGSVKDFKDIHAFSAVAMDAQPDLQSLLAPEQSIEGVMETMQAFMNKSTTRSILNVDWPLDKSDVFNYGVFFIVLPHDFFRHTREQNKLLMNNYKMLQYSGNLDLLVPVAMTEEFLDRVQWKGREQYRRTNYSQWMVGESLAGWKSTTGNFTRVIVRNAGHSVPFYKPQASLKMMKEFVYGQFPSTPVAAGNAKRQPSSGPKKRSPQIGW